VFSNRHVVEEASSRVGVDVFSLLQEDHFSISKPQDRTSGSYNRLSSLLLDIKVEEWLKLVALGNNFSLLRFWCIDCPLKIERVQFPLYKILRLLFILVSAEKQSPR
jgi:hypothetical protein